MTVPACWPSTCFDRDVRNPKTSLLQEWEPSFNWWNPHNPPVIFLLIFSMCHDAEAQPCCAWEWTCKRILIRHNIIDSIYYPVCLIRLCGILSCISGRRKRARSAAADGLNAYGRMRINQHAAEIIPGIHGCFMHFVVLWYNGVSLSYTQADHYQPILLQRSIFFSTTMVNPSLVRCLLVHDQWKTSLITTLPPNQSWCGGKSRHTSFYFIETLSKWMSGTG